MQELDIIKSRVKSFATVVKLLPLNKERIFSYKRTNQVGKIITALNVQQEKSFVPL